MSQPTESDASSSSPEPARRANSPGPAPADLASLLSMRIVGQPTALEAIVPSLQLHQSGLAPEGRPVGVYLLLGPTGTGKTRTVEAVADVLHGDPRKILRVDCGEFQGEHEVAKLIGAPPGYVGHGDSRPRLTQASLEEATTPGCDLALVLFDEIEKAAPTMMQLLLGVLDRARLTLGDGSEVDFSRTLIFLTSNLGAREMMDALQPRMGFERAAVPDPAGLRERLERVGMQAVRKFFSPEFVNRIDRVVTYRPLDTSSIVAILDQHVNELRQHVHSRLGHRSFDIELEPAARYFIIEHGASLEYGARELKRVIHRHLMQPMAARVAQGSVPPGSVVHVDLNEEGDGLTLRVEEAPGQPVRGIRRVLLVDDSDDLLDWMSQGLEEEGFQVETAGSVEEAARAMVASEPDAIVVEYMLPDGDGALLATELVRDFPDTGVVLMSGIDFDEEALVMCRRHGVRMLRKPFLTEELVTVLHSMVHVDDGDTRSLEAGRGA
jgi:CheY-like chemotaxis protein